MNLIIESLRQGLKALVSARFLALVFFPPVVSFLILTATFVTYGADWVQSLARFLTDFKVIAWIQSYPLLSDFAIWSSRIFLFLVSIPLGYLVAVILTSIFVMPLVLKWIGEKEFKHLEKKRGGSAVGSVINTLYSTLLFIAAFLVTLPLWILPGFQLLVPLLLTAGLNKKIFLYDVLQDYATHEERTKISHEYVAPLYGMGMLLGLLAYFPLAFLVIPVLTAVTYTYFGLTALAQERATR